MSTYLELKKYLKNPVTLVLLAVSVCLLVLLMIHTDRGYKQMLNPLIDKATEECTALDEAGYSKATKYVAEHKDDWVYLDEEGQQRYLYEKFYMYKYEQLYNFRVGVEAEKAAAKSTGLSPKDEERFRLIDQRIQDDSVVRRYDSESFLNQLIEKLWHVQLLLSPLIFASIYAYDKYYISPLLAAAPQSGAPYLRAKVRASLILGSLIYWLPVLALLSYYLNHTNFLKELDLPYYYISFLTSWDLTVKQGLSWLVLSGFIQYVYLILIFILISQSTSYVLAAALAGFIYSGGAIFILNWLTQFFYQSILARCIVTLWALTPAGALSEMVRHDYWYPSNFLGVLTFLKDYNLPLVSSTLLMIPLVVLLYKRSRSCFRQTEHTQKISSWLKHLLAQTP